MVTSYENTGLAGLQKFLDTYPLQTLTDAELTALLIYTRNTFYGEDRINRGSVKELINLGLQSPFLPTIVRAFDLATGRTDARSFVVELFCQDCFAAVAQQRSSQMLELVNDDVARQLLARARSARSDLQEVMLRNLYALCGSDSIDGLPKTSASVEALTQRLLFEDETTLAGLLDQLGFSDVDMHVACNGSHRVMTTALLNLELRRLASEIKRADAKSDHKFLYQVRDIGNLKAEAICVVCIEQGGSGAALAYHLRKASGLKIDVLFAGQEVLQSVAGTKMLLLDPIEIAPTEEIKAQLTTLIEHGQLVTVELALDFHLGFNTYAVAKAGLLSSQAAQKGMSEKIALLSRLGFGERLAAAPASHQVLTQIAILAFLLPRGNVQVNAHLANSLTSVLPTQDLLFFLWESHANLCDSTCVDDCVFLVDGSDGGSGLLISYLYRMMTGIGESQLVTLTRSLKKDKVRMGALRKQLKGKKVIVLDDCSMTGNQLVELVNYIKNNFPVTTVSAVVAVATDIAKQQLDRCTDEFVVGQRLPDVRSMSSDLLSVVPPTHAALVELAIKENRYGGDVVTGIVLPHMVPNNTARWLYQLLTGYLELPAAHSEKCAVNQAA